MKWRTRIREWSGIESTNLEADSLPTMVWPMVSVVIPAYNARDTLAATMRSVLDQTVQVLELIVVDDGSTDDTAAVADSIRDPRVRVLRQQNAGHAAARNAGIAVAHGKYVAVVDADDVWLAGKLERQLAVLASDDRIRALHSSAIHVNERLEPLFIGHCPRGRHSLLDALCFRGLPGFMCTLIVERSLLVEIGGFDDSLVILQDWDLAIRLAARGELYGDDVPVTLYRVHASNQSRQVDLHIEPGERVLEKAFADERTAAQARGRRRYVRAHFYAMLSGGNLRVGRIAPALRWGVKALWTDPRVVPFLVAFPLRRARRRLERKRAERVLGPCEPVDPVRDHDEMRVSPE